MQILHPSAFLCCLSSQGIGWCLLPLRKALVYKFKHRSHLEVPSQMNLEIMFNELLVYSMTQSSGHIKLSLGLILSQDFPGGSDSKMFAYNGLDWILGSGRSPGEENSNPLQYSCLENPMDERAWQATVHGVTKSQTRLSDFTFTFILS